MYNALAFVVLCHRFIASFIARRPFHRVCLQHHGALGYERFIASFIARRPFHVARGVRLQHFARSGTNTRAATPAGCFVALFYFE